MFKKEQFYFNYAKTLPNQIIKNKKLAKTKIPYEVCIEESEKSLISFSSDSGKSIGENYKETV